jgi:hypothetical protein
MFMGWLALDPVARQPAKAGPGVVWTNDGGTRGRRHLVGVVTAFSPPRQVLQGKHLIRSDDVGFALF